RKVKPVRSFLKSFYKDLPPEVTIVEGAAAAAKLLGASIPKVCKLAYGKPARNLSQYLIEDGAAAPVTASDIEYLYLLTIHSWGLPEQAWKNVLSDPDQLRIFRLQAEKHQALS